MGKKIKYVLTFIVILIINYNSAAQSGKVPPFSILQTNLKILKAQNLPFEKSIMIIYFSPDCDDCSFFMNNLFNQIRLLNNTSIVMITYSNIKELRLFSLKYKTYNYNNIYIGTEGSTFFIKNYYDIQDLPFIAIYDKDGNLKYTYHKDINVKALINAINKL